MVIDRGRQIFVDVLTRFAEQSRHPRLSSIVRRVSAPVRVAVCGRPGVGRATVATAFADAGIALTADESAADVTALVIAETLKPEDRVAPDKPMVIVLNKADLMAFGAGGPMALAQRRAATIQTSTGTPTVPMIGLLAVAEPDDDLSAALRTLVAAPADLTSVDAFVASAHPLAAGARRRLVDTLDRFGIAHAVLAIEDGADTAAVRALLRRLSHVDAVVAQVNAAAAPVRYRRVCTAITELRTLATRSGDQQIAGFLASDATLLAVMGAAVDVVEADGIRVDRGDDPAAHRRRAIYWRRYGDGPVGALHRSCAADICRGSLVMYGGQR